MEFEAERFYVKAAEQTQDVGVRRLLGDLAEAEKGHEKHRGQADRPDPQPGRARAKRTRRAGACSSCNMCSRVSPD